eukprot:jgi/Botrbrau1/14706/Bobra.0108s0058.2
MEEYNSAPLPHTPDHCFRLNWAKHGIRATEMQGQGVDFALFVGDLAPDVTDYLLQEHFRGPYPSVRSAKVIQDPVSGRSKGFGFVRFADEAERDRALTEMTGKIISNRAIRVSRATSKKPGDGMGSAYHPQTSSSYPSDGDPSNTTLFIGGLAPTVTEDDLRMTFSHYGNIVYTKVPPGKNCGFVQFVLRPDAEKAMFELQGRSLGNSVMRISWGKASRNPGANYPPSQAFSYGYGQEYPTYGPSYYEPYPYPGTMPADPYAQWGYPAMPEMYPQPMYMQPIGPSAPAVATQPPPSVSVPPMVVGANAAGPKVGPFFTPAVKPMERNAVMDQNQGYAHNQLPLYSYNSNFYRQAW